MKMDLKRAGASMITLALCLGMTVVANAQTLNETIDNDNSTLDIDSFTSGVPVSASDISSGGKFRIEYRGQEANIVLILSDQSGSTDHNWVAVSGKTDAGETDTGWYVEYAYDKLTAAWGEDFTDLKVVMAATWGLWDSTSGTTLVKTTTIDSIEWIQSENADEPEGFKINSDESDDIPGFTESYTETVGSDIKDGGKFKVIHSNPAANVVLALTGSDDNHGWINVSPSATGKDEEGNAVCEYSYENIAQAWESNDFSDYLSVRVQTWSGETVVKSIEWISGPEPEQTINAEEISGSPFSDGSRGWTAVVTGESGTAFNLENAQWSITNAEDKMTTVDANIGDTTFSGEGEIIFGLVLSKTAIGENIIKDVEFIY